MHSIWQTRNHQVIYRVHFLFDKLGERYEMDTIVSSTKGTWCRERGIWEGQVTFGPKATPIRSGIAFVSPGFATNE